MCLAFATPAFAGYRVTFRPKFSGNIEAYLNDFYIQALLWNLPLDDQGTFHLVGPIEFELDLLPYATQAPLREALEAIVAGQTRGWFSQIDFSRASPRYRLSLYDPKSHHMAIDIRYHGSLDCQNFLMLSF